MKKGFLMRLRNKNNGVCESKERKKNNLGKIFNRDEYQQKICEGTFFGQRRFCLAAVAQCFGWFGNL
ncbi:hypothetical protein [Haliscomenobacter sp.]|uniref:hypothetical protein n=1 Tax=Haliscomenobacter sp. TaxID=2717303 RepID=UPI003364DCF8